MAYFIPFIDSTGLNIPTYQDIETHLLTQAREIFGADIYLGNDSQDYQFIVATAFVLYDALLTAQLAFNNRTPSTAIGPALDGIVALNGLVRRQETKSTATLTLTGTAFTLIRGGIVGDLNGNPWALPAEVTLDADGLALVTATCTVEGSITAAANTINLILTPTFGWTTATNASPASPGRPLETDSQLRIRQTLSVANPSQTPVLGILGAVLATENVTDAQLYENATSSPVSTINGVTNPNDFPANSITLVVDGGADDDIAHAIAVRKTPGCATVGDVVVDVWEEAISTEIRFYRPIEIPIQVEITITVLPGYNSEVGLNARQAIIDYLNSLTAGQSVVISELWQAALNSDTSTVPRFSLTLIEARIMLSGYAFAATDIPMTFQQKPVSDMDSIDMVVNLS